MLSRIHDQSDILESGKIMLLVDCEPGCYTLTDLEYLEHTLRETLVENHKSLQEMTVAKAAFSLDKYVNMLTAVTNNLKGITDSLLAIKSVIATNNSEPSLSITESFTREIINFPIKKA